MAGAGAAGVDGEAERLADQLLVRLEDEPALVGADRGGGVDAEEDDVAVTVEAVRRVPPVVSGVSELNGWCEPPAMRPDGAPASMSTYQTTGPNTSIDTVAVSVWLAGASVSLSFRV